MSSLVYWNYNYLYELVVILLSCEFSSLNLTLLKFFFVEFPQRMMRVESYDTQTTDLTLSTEEEQHSSKKSAKMIEKRERQKITIQYLGFHIQFEVSQVYSALCCVLYCL